MDFTPPPPSPSPSPSNPPIQQPTPISSIPFPTQKLPIKRKTHTTPTTPTPISPSSDPDDVTPNPPTPFKFHRVWSEPDEIRLLQSLINSSLSFPRDLNIFYTQFISGMSHPYSKSQLSEKLRRLRKKFRAVSSRIAKGLDVSSLSPQDYALYDLSKQLWDPNVVDNSNNSKCRPGIPILQEPMMAILALPSVGKKPNNNGSNRNGNVDNLGNVGNLGDVGKEGNGDLKCEIVGARKVFGVVVEESLKEIRMRIDRESCRDLEKEIEFEKRWRDQRVEEFDVLVKRLKLIVEHGSPLVSK